MDAVRISDGKRVFMKRVQSGSPEITIHGFLSEPNRLNDPRNHTAPLLDTFPDDADPGFTYLVLPLLQRYYRPEFYFVDEVMDFFRQLLQVCSFSRRLVHDLDFFQGIRYMHEVGVAHR